MYRLTESVTLFQHCQMETAVREEGIVIVRSADERNERFTGGEGP